MPNEAAIAELHWAIGRYLSEAGWEIEDEDDFRLVVRDPRSAAFDDGPVRVKLVAVDA